MFVSYKKLDELGYSSMFCENIDDKIIIYGGSNFKNNNRTIYNTIRLYDKDFNLICQKDGLTYPDRCMQVKHNNCVYLISDAIFKYQIIDNEVIEEKIYNLDFKIIGGFCCVYNNKLIFGFDDVFEFDLDTKTLNKRSKFIGKPREQSCYAMYNNYLYVISGCSDIALS